MVKKKRRLLKIILITVISLFVVGFALNWFLTYRLELFLRQELTKRVSDATGGFYKLSFDKLEIGLFSGELLIQNISLTPDTTVMNKLEAAGNLPDTYLNLKVQSIHFKGLNLTWRRNYKQLHFALFEIKSPYARVYESKGSGRSEKEEIDKPNQTLYELVSPYIDVLSVKRMNLEHATVSYHTRDPFMPTVYELDDVSFHAYGFLLDKNSSDSGKLIYCNDFDFTTNKPQVLFNNREMAISTDKIKLSTHDSLIHISGISLQPQELLWMQTNQKPDNYIQAKVDLVEMKGIKFTRNKGKNSLSARSFDIVSTDIESYTTKRVKEDKKIKKQTDTISQSLDLYNMLSPILESVSVDIVGIKNAKLKHSLSFQNSTDVFVLNRFDFKAFDFHVDSLSGNAKNFLYSESFRVNAEGINAELQTQNQNMSVERMSLNTIVDRFQLKDIELLPLSTSKQFNYLKGHIYSLTIDGLNFDTGLGLKRLSVDAPHVEYVKNIRRRAVKYPKKKNVNLLDSIDAITNISNYLSIAEIELKNASLGYRDNTSQFKQHYQINNLNFFAENFRIDEQTIRNPKQIFSCSGFKLNFRNFDNVLPGGDHRLKIRNANLSTYGGVLSLEGIQLIPLEGSWKKVPDMFIKAEIQAINAIGVNYDRIIKQERIIEGGTVKVESPRIKIVKTREVQHLQSAPKNDPSIEYLVLDALQISDTLRVEIVDKVTQKSTSVSLKDLELNTFTWHPQKSIDVGVLRLNNPVVKLSENGTIKQAKIQQKTSISESVNIGKLDIITPRLQIKDPDLSFDFKIEEINLSNFNWNNKLFNLQAARVVRPNIDVEQAKKQKAESSQKIKDPNIKDLYRFFSTYSDVFHVGSFNVIDANVNYRSLNSKKTYANQKINKLNIEVDDLAIDTYKRSIKVSELNFDTKDLQVSMSDGFYNLKIGDIGFRSKNEILKIDKLHFEAKYPKMQFAYEHPRHKDWFDVTVGNITMAGIDIPSYIFNKALNITKLHVSDVMLQNFKNQQIEIQHNIMPLIYEGLQKLPVRLAVDDANFFNFSVIYEELAKKGTHPGKISFEGMNAKIKGLTNVVAYPNQYMAINVDGKFMGTGDFTAQWKIPVDSLNDCFMLNGHLRQFNLRDLNQVVSALAPAEVVSGIANDTKFEIEASSYGANVKMLFQYHNLKVNIYKDLDEKNSKKLMTSVVNSVIKKNNPNSKWSLPRKSELIMVRDPYHSTFNYFWQILQPALVESVGVTQDKQNLAKKVAKFVSQIKKVFQKK